MKRAAALLLVAVACAGCASSAARPKAAATAKATCTPAQLAGWKKLARRIQAPVYCPSWLPDPLDGVIGSRWNNIDAVSRDRSYLESWVWQETGMGAAGGELHVNLRGYPGRTRIPKCVDDDTAKRTLIPCFDDPHGVVHGRGLAATVFTVNQDADQWARGAAVELHQGARVPRPDPAGPRSRPGVKLTRREALAGAAAAALAG